MKVLQNNKNINENFIIRESSNFENKYFISKATNGHEYNDYFHTFLSKNEDYISMSSVYSNPEKLKLFNSENEATNYIALYEGK